MHALQQRPFIFWLVVVQLLAVLPTLGFAAVLVQRLVGRGTERVVSEMEQKAHVAADALAREADRVKTKLQLLATQPPALAGDIGGVRRQAASILATDDVLAGAAALDRGGQVLFDTRQPPGVPLPRLARLPSAEAVFTRGETDVGGLSTGGSGDERLLAFAAPWRVDGEVRYLLRMALKPAALSQVLQAQRWPGSWTAAVLDQDLRVVARSRDEALHFNQPASPSLQALIRTQGEGRGRSLTRDGTEAVSVVVRVRGTPWFVVAGLPAQALEAEAALPYRQLMAGGLAVVLLGTGASFLLSRRLSREMTRATQGGEAGPFAVRELAAVQVQRLMLDNDLIGMVRLRERRAVWHNRALERMFGYGPGELDGHSPRQMHRDDASFEAFGRDAYATLQSGRAYRAELQMVRKDGSPLWVDVSGIEVLPGETLWLVLDISAAKALQARTEALAFHDPLTGVANRALLMDRLKQAMTEARRTGHAVAVCFVDLNGFKAINDQRGHAAGDELLCLVARRLESCMRAHDTVARLGGDEFVLLLQGLDDAGEADTLRARLQAAMADPLVVGGEPCAVSAATGCAIFPLDGVDTPEAMVQLADLRMYRDKAQHHHAPSPATAR